MLSSLRFRLWLTYFVVVMLVIGIAGTAVTIYLLRNPASDRRELQRLRVVSSLVLQRSQAFGFPPKGEYSLPILKEAAQRADETWGVRIIVFSPKGDLIVDSRATSEVTLPDWSFFTQRRPNTAPIFTDSNQRRWLYDLTPMEGGNILLLAVPRPRVPVWSILRDELSGPFLRGTALALLLSMLLAFWISRWISDPLQRIANATRSMSSGDFRPIPEKGPQEVRKLAKAFNEMGERVQASQRSQRDFIANVSHDLKTPLTSIQGFAQAILDGTAGEGGSLKQAAQVILSEAERMYRMVLDLLELARLDSRVVEFERSPVNLNALIKAIAEKFSPLAASGNVKMEFFEQPVSGEHAVTVIGDADRLNQVFSNLVDNALKYTPSGGKVGISLQSVDGWVEIRVADNGVGIPDEEIGRIFERFYQTDKSRRGGSGRGVGLGLAIAKEIVLAHDGEISATNRVYPNADRASTNLAGSQNSGSVFLVRLPVARPDDITMVSRRKAQPTTKA